MSELIIDAYTVLSQNYNQYYTDVAVRSSATAEDLPDASFAGQQETFLNVHGPANLIDSVRNCFASLFTDRAISYRHTFGYDHFNVGLSICVQKMVRSDLASAGVAFSLDPESGFKEVVVINGSYGLGEMVVQGSVLPDEFIVFKPVLLNVASPSKCFQFSHLPAKGVGLAREEFIMSNYIQIHPLALLHHKKLNDEVLTKEIEKRIAGYVDEEDYFVKKLSFGIAKIASSFYPNKVIVRFSDFKSNEYSNLLGGSYFEPHEENPMIGWRGASRYYSDTYKPAFGLECEAIKVVRDKFGLNNVIVMIPFCRTVEELLKVKEVMEEFGLKWHENDLQIYLMAEIPSNILLADEFAKYIDGFSIGSNDLTYPIEEPHIL